jgi:hypothetical protein
MEEFETLLEELFFRYPQLMSEKWFRELEDKVRAEITRINEIMNSAGIA